MLTTWELQKCRRYLEKSAGQVESAELTAMKLRVQVLGGEKASAEEAQGSSVAQSVTHLQNIEAPDSPDRARQTSVEDISSEPEFSRSSPELSIHDRAGRGVGRDHRSLERSGAHAELAAGKMNLQVLKSMAKKSMERKPGALLQ